ncbi:MAG: hypothetical protein ACXQS5_05740 [Candidatus Methanospirareceae archaeon]
MRIEEDGKNYEIETLFEAGDVKAKLTEKQRKVKIMLFLGAGASKPFGIATMEEMSRKFKNDADTLLYEDGGFSDAENLYHEIYDAVGANLEDVLTVLDELIRGVEMRNLSVTYMKSSIKKYIKMIYLLDFNKKIETVLCLIPSGGDISNELQSKMEDKWEDITKNYNKLFKIVSIKNNIDPIEGDFGEEEVFEELKQKLS